MVLWGHYNTVRFLEQSNMAAFQPGWGRWEVLVMQDSLCCLPFVFLWLLFQEILACCPGLLGYLG